MEIYRPRFEKRGGILPAWVQDAASLEMLMPAYTDEACFLETIQSGEVVLYSTSKKRRWKKGEESGNTLKLIEVRIDCDGDAILYLVQVLGPGVACHTGSRSCFYRAITGQRLMRAPQESEEEVLVKIEADVHQRLAPPQTQSSLL